MDHNAALYGPATAPHGLHASGRLPAGLFIAAAILSGYTLARCLQRTARLKRQVDDLAYLSRTDPLTGLPNRRHIEECLAAAISGARRHRQSLSVLFVDIDGFKRINDRLGYEVGDEVLRVVGERIRAILRSEDIVGRWGGEEFLALLATTDLEGAVTVAERVRTGIAVAPIGVADGEVHVTVSIGCASGPADLGPLVSQAADALRRAKRAGKNRVVAACPSED